MRKAPIKLRDLRRRIYVKAKAEPEWRFWGLYVHVCKLETLREAYALAKRNDGSPGIDGVTFEAIEAGGVESFLERIRDELVTGEYLPQRNRRQEIPKDGGKVRVLGIPTIRDRVVQGALKLIVEPIFEADFQAGSYGYRPQRSAHDAVERVAEAIVGNKTRVIDVDLSSYFDNVRHHVRWADDLVILVDAYQRHDWLLAAVDQRLREELEHLQLEVNEDKSRTVDLAKGESFGFLGFEFRRVRSLRGVWRSQYTPQTKKRSALLRKLKEIFRRYRSQPVGRVVEIINPILRGWVNYFAIGHASRCFGYVRDWVEKKIRRHMMRAKNRRGYGWKRWSREWLYERLGLYGAYRVRRPWATPKALPTR